MTDELIQGFGFTEMYEWEQVPEPQFRLGRFVTFSKSNPNKIVAAQDTDDYIIGVTSVNSVLESDNPNEWKYKNICNEFGDMYLRKEKLAVGQKVYDQILEMNYIRTSPWEHYIPIPNKHYDSSKNYVKRTNRPEWVRVTLIGKAIVEDNGECKAGEFCTPYTGKVKTLRGTVVPAQADSKHKYYVLERLSEKTILVLNK